MASRDTAFCTPARTSGSRHGKTWGSLLGTEPVRDGAALLPEGSLGSFNSTKTTCVGVSPMFSPWCCCAGNQPTVPDSRSTSRWMSPETRRRRNELRVYMTLSGCMWRRLVARLIRVLEDTDPVVLEDDLVVLRIRDRGIEAHAMSMPARASPRRRSVMIPWTLHAEPPCLRRGRVV